MAKKLKVLNLTGCKELVKTPDLSSHLLLEQLILEGCLELVEIDESISMLKHLVIINLRECTRLKKLPRELSCMESLEELNISRTLIEEIPSWPLMRRLRVFNSSICFDLNKVGSLNFAYNITQLIEILKNHCTPLLNWKAGEPSKAVLRILQQNRDTCRINWKFSLIGCSKFNVL